MTAADDAKHAAALALSNTGYAAPRAVGVPSRPLPRSAAPAQVNPFTSLKRTDAPARRLATTPRYDKPTCKRRWCARYDDLEFGPMPDFRTERFQWDRRMSKRLAQFARRRGIRYEEAIDAMIREVLNQQQFVDEPQTKRERLALVMMRQQIHIHRVNAARLTDSHHRQVLIDELKIEARALHILESTAFEIIRQFITAPEEPDKAGALVALKAKERTMTTPGIPFTDEDAPARVKMANAEAMRIAAEVERAHRAADAKVAAPKAASELDAALGRELNTQAAKEEQPNSAAKQKVFVAYFPWLKDVLATKHIDESFMDTIRDSVANNLTNGASVSFKDLPGDIKLATLQKETFKVIEALSREIADPATVKNAPEAAPTAPAATPDPATVIAPVTPPVVSVENSIVAPIVREEKPVSEKPAEPTTTTVQLATLTGVPIAQISARMNEQLPPEAYGPIKFGTMSGKTDLDGDYVRDRFDEVFGMGGWRITPHATAGRVENRREDRPNKQGELQTWYVVDLIAHTFQYAVVNASGVITWVEASTTSDSHDNVDETYAFRGALTSIMKQFYRLFGGMNHIIRGEYTHVHAARDIAQRNRNKAA